jgi:hypothetical protein
VMLRGMRTTERLRRAAAASACCVASHEWLEVFAPLAVQRVCVCVCVELSRLLVTYGAKIHFKTGNIVQFID